MGGLEMGEHVFPGGGIVASRAEEAPVLPARAGRREIKGILCSLDSPEVGNGLCGQRSTERSIVGGGGRKDVVHAACRVRTRGSNPKGMGSKVGGGRPRNEGVVVG